MSGPGGEGGEHVLVTGASGFIGAAVVRELLRMGVPVTATARRPTETLARELGAPVTSLDVLKPLPSFASVRTVVHCATPNDIVTRAPDGGLPLAVQGTRALIEHALAHGVKRLVFLSTLQVYGTELAGTVDEDRPVRCETLYGLNHHLGEEVCRFYARTADLDVVLLRPANVYGVPEAASVDRWTLVPMCFVREARETGAVTLRSSGRQRRNFVSTGEVATTIAHLLDHFPPGCTVINAGSDWSASMLEIAGLVAEAWLGETGAPLPVHVLSDQPAQPQTFTVGSRSSHPRLTPAQSRQRMTEVIAGLLRATRPH